MRKNTGSRHKLAGTGRYLFDDARSGHLVIVVARVVVERGDILFA